MISSQDNAKRKAAKAAADFVKQGMLVGLGTGSTASYFIDALIEQCRKGLRIQAVATSEKSLRQAQEGGIPIANMDDLLAIDLTIDGADEIDFQKRMIKGGGGALLREKIIASISHEVIIIIDESKVVKNLGAFPLPVELVPFAYHATIHRLMKLGYHGTLRKKSDQTLYITDNNHYIYDIHLECPNNDPEKDNEKIRSIPGVVETGFFFNLATKVIIGFFDGHIEIRT